MWSLPAEGQSKLKDDGFFCGEGIIDDAAVSAISSELADWKNTPAINGYGCLFQHGDALLQNLGLYSATALHAALNEKVLDFMEAHYGEPALLVKCEYRRSVQKKEEMALHSDGLHEISIYIFLQGVDEDRGATTIAVGSHNLPGSRARRGAYQITEDIRSRHTFPMVAARGGPGLALFFNVGAWHMRTRTKRPGRELLWFQYAPVSRPEQCIELTFARNSLQGLSVRQMKALGIGVPNVGARRGEDFRMSRSFSPDNLKFVTTCQLVATLVRRAIDLIRATLPRSLKRAIKKLLYRRNRNTNSAYR